MAPHLLQKPHVCFEERRKEASDKYEQLNKKFLIEAINELAKEIENKR